MRIETLAIDDIFLYDGCKCIRGIAETRFPAIYYQYWNIDKHEGSMLREEVEVKLLKSKRVEKSIYGVPLLLFILGLFILVLSCEDYILSRTMAPYIGFFACIVAGYLLADLYYDRKKDKLIKEINELKKMKSLYK